MADLQTATLGGGCYWCLEAYFQRVRGVETILSGYSGGHVDNPTTERVYRGDTGHAEVVQIQFDPTVISYGEILEIFFVMHDPTTLNRQGNDVGDLYRSVIFYHDIEQQGVATEMAGGFAASIWKDPIVTQIMAYISFWPADETMQEYYNRNRSVPYCQIVIDPKIAKLRQQFAAKLKA